MEKNTNLHVVMFPWLAMGHLIPFLKLSKSLAQKGHLVSFISTPGNIHRLPRIPKNLSHLINLVRIPFPSVNNLPDGAESSMDIPYTKAQFLKIAFDLLQPEISSFLETSNPKPDWIIYDYASHWIPNIAAKAGVCSAYFSLFTAATMAYTGPPSMVLSEGGGDSRSTAEDFTIVPKWIPFESNIKYYLHEVSRYVESSAGNESGTSDVIRFAASVDGCDIVVFRTCVDFEPEWFNLVCELYKKPVIPIGVLPSSCEDEEMGISLNWFSIKKWLDRQKVNSVVYVALGTEAVLEQEQVEELAIGLEQCGLPFFWVLRDNPGSTTRGVVEMLPQGFKDRIKKDDSMVYNEWVPQVNILSHQAIGGFLTHCGWNSVIEALSFGKVLILLPVMNDQGLNARLLQEKRVGLVIPRNVGDGAFTRTGVAETVRFVVVSEEGKSMRANARGMKALFGNVDKNQSYVDKFVSCLVEKRGSKS